MLIIQNNSKYIRFQEVFLYCIFIYKYNNKIKNNFAYDTFKDIYAKTYRKFGTFKMCIN